MIAIVIPALNEAVTITEVVKDALMFGSVIVVDDGSTDNTAELAKASGATVVKHEKNKGYGAALKTGINKALELNANVIVTIDADGQHDVWDMGYMLDPILDNEADVVIGSRYLKPDRETPFYRRIGQKILDFATCPDGAVTDSQSGYRAFRASCMDAFKFKSSGMALASEMLQDALRAGLRVTEVPISVRYEGLNCSTYNPIVHGLSVLTAVIASNLTYSLQSH